MKKSAVIFSLIFFGLVYGDWEWSPIRDHGANGVVLEAVHFFDTLHGIIGGMYSTTGQGLMDGYGNILVGPTDEIGAYLAHSNDGGITWERRDIAGIDVIYDIRFIDRDTGWLAGVNWSGSCGGVIFKTTNGGAAWDLVYFDTSVNIIHKIAFPTPLEGYFVGATKYSNPSSNCGTYFNDDLTVVGKTSDGGKTWTTTVLHDLRSGASDIFFTCADTGWITGNEKLIRTVDGGNTWNLVSFPVGAYSLFFVDGKKGWVGGKRRSIYYTEDGGNKWDIIYDVSSSLEYEPIRAIHFVNDSVGWAFSGGRVTGMQFSNKTFLIQNGKAKEIIMRDGLFDSHNWRYGKRVFFVGSNHGWIVGDFPIVIRTTDNGGFPQPVSVKHGLRQKQTVPAQFVSISNRTLNLRLSDRGKVDIYALNGAKLHSLDFAQGSHIHRLNDLPRGMYVVRATSGAWKQSVRMVVK